MVIWSAGSRLCSFLSLGDGRLVLEKMPNSSSKPKSQVCATIACTLTQKYPQLPGTKSGQLIKLHHNSRQFL